MTVIDSTTQTTFRATTDQVALTAGLKNVLNAVSSRPPVPVLAGVLISATDTGLTLQGFDYEVSITEKVAGIGAGSILVHAADLLDMVKDLAKGCPITFSQNETKVLVEGDGVTYTLLTMPLDEYPSLLADADVNAANLGTEELASVLDVSTVASKDRTLPILNATQFVIKTGHFSAAATDRYRLGLYEYESTYVGPDVTLIVPAATLALVGKLFAKTGASFSFHVGQGIERVTFSNATTTLTAQTREGDFPKVEKLFPDYLPTTALVDQADVLKSLKLVAKATAKNGPVLIGVDATANQLVFSAHAGEDKAATRAIDASVDGESVVTGLNPAYAESVLKALGSSIVQFAFSHSHKPMVITSTARPGLKFLQMPVRIAQ